MTLRDRVKQVLFMFSGVVLGAVIGLGIYTFTGPSPVVHAERAPDICDDQWDYEYFVAWRQFGQYGLIYAVQYDTALTDADEHWWNCRVNLVLRDALDWRRGGGTDESTSPSAPSRTIGVGARPGTFRK